MRKISSFSVNYPISVLMMVLAVILLGTISFDKLAVDLFPDLNNPRLFVDMEAGELPPEEMESRFVEGIESVAMRQKNVIEISSISRVGAAQITVEYSWNTDMDEALLDLQKSLTNFTQNSTLELLQVSQQDFNNEPVMLLGFYHPDGSDLDDLRLIAVNYLRNELIRLEGIAAVEVVGSEEKELVIETNQYLLDAYDISMNTISSKINDLNRDMSAGSITEMGRKYIINSKGVFNSIDDFADLVVSSPRVNPDENPDNRVSPVYLKDVAKLFFQRQDAENIVRLNQRKCLGLAIYKESKYNTVQAVEEINIALVDLKKALPGYELEVISNQADFINQAINEVEESALIGIFLAIIILFVFLRRIGTTAVISIAIPVSIIATFNLMYFNGLSLNIMTLGGLALGAGMLVDNAIIVMENIFRNIESGLTIKEASIKGASEVSGAITASTLTTIIVFLPIVYVHGAAGELFKEQAWTVAFSLLSSLVVAILLIPMLSSKILKPQKKENIEKSIHFSRYGEYLGKFLDRRWYVILFAALLIAITTILLPFLGSDFMPSSESDNFQLEITLEEGTALPGTDKFAVGIESLVREFIGKDLSRIYTHVGSAGETAASEGQGKISGENSILIQVFLKTDNEKGSVYYVQKIAKQLDEFPDIEYNFVMEESSLQATLGIEMAPVVIEIAGEDLEELSIISTDIIALLKEMESLENIEGSFSRGRPQVDVNINRMKAGLYGISVEEVSNQIEELLLGKDVGQWETGGELRDITIKSPTIGLNQLSNLVIKNGNEKIYISEIAEINISRVQNEVNRRNQSRIGRITAQIKGDIALNKVIGQIEDRLSDFDLPADYKIAISGEEQKRSESFGSLKFALILSIILIYMVMAAQFESLIHPFTILLTIPLAGVGAIIIFLVLGLSLNIMAYIGIIMLVGIAVNDSIIFVDAINQLRSTGSGLRESIIAAGQRRIRPIIMTSLTTILALLPLTINYGESASLRSPMALAVIGGLVTSTLLTLVVIPCVYSVLDQLRPGNK